MFFEIIIMTDINNLVNSKIISFDHFIQYSKSIKTRRYNKIIDNGNIGNNIAKCHTLSSTRKW